MSDYTDEELRMRALPLAVDLVNTEVQRVLGKCNTAAIADITKELANIIKYGSVNAPVEVADGTPVSDTVYKAGEVSEAKFEEIKPEPLKYA